MLKRWLALFRRASGSDADEVRDLGTVALAKEELAEVNVEIEDPATGETRRYTNIDDLPPEMRQQVEAALAGAGSGDVEVIERREYRFDDGTGEKVYESLDAMPPHVRALFERARAR